MCLNNSIKKLAVLLLIFGVASLVSRIPAQDATEQTNKDRTEVSKQPPQLSAASYAKIHVEVELRGTLRSTDNESSLIALWRTYEIYHEDKEISRATSPETWTLDFSRAKQFKPTASALDGKDVVITGQCELRMVVQPLPPGGTSGGGLSGSNIPPAPTWSVHHTVLVSGVRLPDGK